MNLKNESELGDIYIAFIYRTIEILQTTFENYI